MTETNIDLLKQIFWKTWRKLGITVDITKARICIDNEQLAMVDFEKDKICAFFYKEIGNIDINQG